MTNRNLLLVLNTNQEYIRHTDSDSTKYAAQMNIFFEAISFTYLPLLKVFENLERDGVQFSLSLVISPSSCAMLDDPIIQKQYIEWLDAHIELGKKEIDRNQGNKAFLDNAKYVFEKFQEDKLQFLNYEQKLLKKFKEYQNKGVLEILGTAGTSLFMPHYTDMTEILNAQVETGLNAYKHYFNELPYGFWLPELGYASGVENVLRSYGYNYTILDTQSFLFAQEEPKNGIFSPVRFDNSLAIFGRDYLSDKLIFGEEGYCNNSVYRNKNHDIGFGLPVEQLNPCISENSQRYVTGFSYWNKNVDDFDEDFDYSSCHPDDVYDIEAAHSQVKTDAENFISNVMNRLGQAEELLFSEQYVNMVCTIDLDRLRNNWSEGMFFIENIFRCGSWQQLIFAQPYHQIGNLHNLQKIKPYYGSVNGRGYGEDFLSNKNSWMMRYLRKASERMVDLAERFSSDTGLKSRLLNLGAKELMLAQSTVWAKMLNDNFYPEYAEQRFKRSIADFTTVFDALGSNTVSTEWLTNLEREHQIFPWMNYRIFEKKR